jgi:hypothetical protein
VNVLTDNPRSSDHTVGAAIEIMEENLARSGIELTVNANNKGGGEEETEGKDFALPGKLACLWLMVYLGITHAFDTGTATQESVSKISTMEALVPGNVVALYLPNAKKFLRIWGETVEFCGGNVTVGDALPLPIEWDLERFLVVDAGRGRVAFFNPNCCRFLGVVDGTSGLATAKAFAITDLDDCPRGNESFLPVSEGPGKFRLYCSSEKAYLNAPAGQATFMVMQICGFHSE